MSGPRAAIFASVVDAALASLATFAAGLYAARFLSTAELGYYALLFAAFVAGSIIPRQLVFLPVELWSSGKSALPIGLLRRGLLVGTLTGIGGGLAIPLAAFIGSRQPGATQVLLALSSAWVLTLLSPVQDHLRRMLHILGRSGSAAVVSTVQAIIVAGGLVLFSAEGGRGSWIPFASLVLANAVSSAVALLCAVRAPRSTEAIPGVSEILGTGRWLLPVGLIPTGTGLLVAAVVTLMAGSEALGIAEAARVVSRPLLVLATGLSAVLGPRSVAAVRSADRAQANRVVRTNALIVLGGAVAYGLFVSIHSSWNLLAGFVPTAYTLAGIVPLTLVAGALDGLAIPYQYELMAFSKGRRLTGIETLGNVARAGVAVLSTSLGAFAVPLGMLLLASVRAVGGLLSRRREAWTADPPKAAPIA